MKKNTVTTKQLIVLAGIYFAFTVLFTWPLILVMGKHGREEDLYLFLWILSWNAHAILHYPLQIFDANIFYPAQNTLALTDHFLGLLPIYGPVIWLTDNPNLGLNVCLIIAFWFTGLFTHLFAYRLTGNHVVSLIAGLIAGFNPAMISSKGALQTASIQWIPLVFLFSLKFLEEGRKRDAWFAGSFLLLQFLTGLYQGYSVAIAASIFFVLMILVGPNSGRWNVIKKGVPALVICGAIMIVSAIPFLIASRQGSIDVPQIDYLRGSITPPIDMITTNPYNYIDNILGLPNGDNIGFQGFIYPLLFIVGLISSLRSFKHSYRSKVATMLSLTSIVMYILSLGPKLFWMDTDTGIILPYALIAKFIPGLWAIREPLRFIFASTIIGAPVAALGAMFIVKYTRQNRFIRIIPGIIAALVFIEYLNKPLSLRLNPFTGELPPVYSWIKENTDDSAILELPFEPDLMIQEHLYTYFAGRHLKKIVNGYSGHFPWSERELYSISRNLPDKSSIKALSALNVRFIVFHSNPLSWIKPIDINKVMSAAGYTEITAETDFISYAKTGHEGPEVIVNEDMVKWFERAYIFGISGARTEEINPSRITVIKNSVDNPGCLMIKGNGGKSFKKCFLDDKFMFPKDDENPFYDMDDTQLESIGIRVAAEFEYDKIYEITIKERLGPDLTLTLDPRIHKISPTEADATLFLAGKNGLTWVNPKPNNPYKFSYTLSRLGGGNELTGNTRVRLPVVVLADEKKSVTIRFTLPKQKGMYHLELYPDSPLFNKISTVVQVH